MDVFPKYLIEDKYLVIGKVTFHKELIFSLKSEIKGGGWFNYDEGTKTFHLYSSSADFGQAKFEDVEKCIKSGLVGDHLNEDEYKDYNFTYSTASKYKDSVLDRIPILKN